VAELFAFGSKLQKSDMLIENVVHKDCSEPRRGGMSPLMGFCAAPPGLERMKR
jgi:hypothetical protein